MVLDSSAIVAILLKEAGHGRLIEALSRSEIAVVGTPTLLETSMVLTSRLGRDARPLLSAFLSETEAEVIAFTEEHRDSATAAFLRFGRGRHPAALNFGDCMSYAVADVARMPLLFTGEDFARTDIGRA